MAKIFYHKKYDSNEEFYFELWLTELKDRGFIYNYYYQPDPFKLNEPVYYTIYKKLKTKTKIEQRTLLQAREYTPDYKIVWKEKARGIFYNNLEDEIEKRPLIFAQNNVSYVDIKGTFNQHSSWGIFEAARKDIWEKFNIFIEKVKPIGKKDCLFGKTFTPEMMPIWQQRDNTKKYAWVNWEVRTIETFLKGE